MAIKLLENDLPVKKVSGITGLDFEYVEKLDSFYFCDMQGTSVTSIELKHEIAKCLLELPFMTDEEIVKNAKLTVKEVEEMRVKE